MAATVWKPAVWDTPQNGRRYCAMRGDEVARDARGPIILGSRDEAADLAHRLNGEADAGEVG